jgi:hypothetical protein
MHRSMPIDHHVPFEHQVSSAHYIPSDHHVFRQVRAWAVAVAMLLLVLPGCDWPNDDSDSGPKYRDHVASVGSATAPDQTAVGSVFDVTIGTNAPNGCWGQGHDRVQVLAPLLVRITPYDRENISSDVCPQNAPTFEHVVPVTAPAAGTLKIEVLRRLRAVSGKDSIGVIEKFVTVH